MFLNLDGKIWRPYINVTDWKSCMKQTVAWVHSGLSCTTAAHMCFSIYFHFFTDDSHPTCGSGAERAHWIIKTPRIEIEERGRTEVIQTVPCIKLIEGRLCAQNGCTHTKHNRSRPQPLYVMKSCLFDAESIKKIREISLKPQNSAFRSVHELLLLFWTELHTRSIKSYEHWEWYTRIENLHQHRALYHGFGF